jgi:hypothetical protein
MKFALSFLFWTYFLDNSTVRVISPTSEFFLAFKSQFAPKCKRWHHSIGTLNRGKPPKKTKKVTT